MAIGASPGGRGTPKSTKVQMGGGKGKGGADADGAYLVVVADSPGSMMTMMGMGMWDGGRCASIASTRPTAYNRVFGLSGWIAECECCLA